ncbi:metallophosphoesterase family protein [Anaerosacchariphilus polymeriproducens]|uniref:Phosphoesterase n=1 Tax=Anaerosacchariphilus polymeriproducens TaxID=1812858 RepID=A0A371AYX8_9FIRM|nr:metallophosphoesterase [Anaerosacchariphilus polymeriproducens]RDU24767.1 metallophosphoesterase [Anaerosacchariphilus polymeriproducens]
MKVLIVSDTHGKNKNLELVLEREKNIDMLIHLGDVEGSELYISRCLKCPVEIVAGNNDFFSSLEKERELMIGKYKVLITHGHYYYVNEGLGEAYKEAMARGIDIFMFGHTHKPILENRNGIILLNPGSLSYPRQDGRLPSYAIMEADDEGTPKFEINYLEK